MLDRYGARGVIFIGAIIFGLGFVLLSQMSNLWYLYVGWTIVGIGSAAMGHVPVTAVVSNWFRKRRGTVIGIMSVGVGAGGFVLAPIIGGYLIPNFGWRASYFASALLLWVTIPLALIVIKTNTAEMGLYPDGAEAPETEALTSPSGSKGLSPKMALATPAFWLIAVGFILSQAVGAGIVQNQVP
jgi:MFS family permease